VFVRQWQNKEFRTVLESRSLTLSKSFGAGKCCQRWAQHIESPTLSRHQRVWQPDLSSGRREPDADEF
jgi:hypothetical protein